ncbi:hypothetical protein MEQU1_000395 [Malassezia equina]|uniref:Uncharacterized protein n=1 Tax=Malassezia equina TaxID=1381935 RepID=A0AAF0EBZ2_9BASI|nr:hypothetical protein MEQU1_000395 [Malassezia equina]
MSPDSATQTQKVQGVRRSRRLAAKGVAVDGPVAADAPMPPTPRPSLSSSRFPGPSPTWVSDPTAPIPRVPSPPQMEARPASSRVVAWDSSVLDSMPSSSTSSALAIHTNTSTRHMRHLSDSHGPKVASPATALSPSPLSSSISSPRLSNEDWPLNEPLAKSTSPPATPIIDVLEHGVFPDSDLPESVFPLVASEDAQSPNPTRHVSLAMERSATMRREMPLAIASLPSAPGVVGLGIDMTGTDQAVERVSTKLASLSMEPAPRRALADRANAPARVPLSEKSKGPLAPGRVALGDKGAVKGTSSSLPKHSAKERLDENGQPWTGPPGPMQRMGLPAPRKVRPSPSQEGAALLLAHPAGRGAPAVQLHTRPVYTLR